MKNLPDSLIGFVAGREYCYRKHEMKRGCLLYCKLHVEILNIFRRELQGD
jgi:hypothetical protein